MKKIINGKKYDTETAKEVACNSWGYYGDLNFVAETLYKKRTGEYFMYAEGGANTIYATQCGCNSWGSGWRITPFTENQAKKWGEENMDGDTYEDVFGAVEE